MQFLPTAMTARPFTLYCARHFRQNMKPKSSITRYFHCAYVMSAIKPDTISFDAQTVCSKRDACAWSGFRKRGSSQVGCTWYSTFSFVRSCHRKFHFAAACNSSDPVSKKVGISPVDGAEGYTDSQKTLDQAPRVDVSSCHDDKSFIFHSDEEQLSSKSQSHGSDKTKLFGNHSDDSFIQLEFNNSKPSLQLAVGVDSGGSDQNASGGHGNHHSLETVSPNQDWSEILTPPQNEDEIEISETEIVPFKRKQKSKQLPVHNLAALVDKSPTLTELVKLGVDFSELEKVDGAADLIAKLDFEKDIRPYLLFLSDVGLPEDTLGHYLSRNPLVLEKDLAELQTTIRYMESKRFDTDAIARIVSKCYVFLVLPLSLIDAKLGFLQRRFHLTGDEVRSVVTRQPKLIAWKTDKLKDTILYIKDFLGFSESEMKEMLQIQPKVFLTNKYSLGKKFDFLHNVMMMEHDSLAQWPNVFRTRLHLLQQRHSYLTSLARAQYDPERENYVSLKALVGSTEREFCERLAKTSVPQFHDFLKTL